MNVVVPTVNSIWFGSESKKFQVYKIEESKVFYRPYISKYKQSDQEFSTTLEAFKFRFSPFIPAKSKKY